MKLFELEELVILLLLMYGPSVLLPELLKPQHYGLDLDIPAFHWGRGNLG